MYLSDVRNAVREAKATQRAIEDQASELAKLLVGNLRNVTKSNYYHDHELLRDLKRELTQYDASRRRWKK